jgi:hypothetical protein
LNLMLALLVQRDKFKSLIKRVSILTLFFFTLSANANQVLTNEEIQKRFQYSIQVMDSNIDESIRILEELSEITSSPRIKLELARAYYFAGRDADAKVLFKDSLRQDLPVPVRDKIEFFLNEIDVNLNPLSISFGLISDSNPRARPKEQQITLFGQNFNYKPDSEIKNELGLLTSLAYVNPQRKNKFLDFSFQLDHFDYSTKENDRTIFRTNLLKRPSSIPYIQYGFSYEESMLSYESLYRLNSLVVALTKELDNKNAFVVTGKRGKIKFPDFNYLDGMQSSSTVTFIHDLNPYSKIFFDYSYETGETNSDMYSYFSNTYGVGFKWSTNFEGIQISGRLSKSNREYGFDPLFQTNRVDDRNLRTLSVTKRDFYIWGLRPSIEFTDDIYSSTIPIASYKKKIYSLMFTKVF